MLYYLTIIWYFCTINFYVLLLFRGDTTTTFNTSPLASSTSFMFICEI